MLDKNKHTPNKTKQNKIISDFVSVQVSMKTCFQVTNTLSGGPWKVRQEHFLFSVIRTRREYG